MESAETDLSWHKPEAPITQRNWVLKDSFTKFRGLASTWQLDESYKLQLGRNFNNPIITKKINGINSLNDKVWDSFGKKLTERQRMTVLALVEWPDINEITTKTLGGGGDRKKPVTNIDNKQTPRQAALKHLHRNMMREKQAAAAAALTGSYRRKGRRIVEESFQFIESELNGVDRMNGGPYKRNQWVSDSCLVTTEPIEMSPETILGLDKTYFSDPNISIIEPNLPVLDEYMSHGHSMAPARLQKLPIVEYAANGAVLQYRDSEGEVCAVFEKKTTKNGQSHVSFNEKIVYLEAVAAEIQKANNKKYFSLSDQTAVKELYSRIRSKPAQIPRVPRTERPIQEEIEDSPVPSPLEPQIRYSDGTTPGCDVCAKLNEMSNDRSHTRVCRMCLAYGNENRRKITRLNPLFIEDDDNSSLNLELQPRARTPLKQMDNGDNSESPWGDSVYSEITSTATDQFYRVQSDTAQYTRPVTFEIESNGVSYERRSDEIQKASIDWRRSRKLCMAVLLMTFIVALAGVGIGLTIYLD